MTAEEVDAYRMYQTIQKKLDKIQQQLDRNGYQRCKNWFFWRKQNHIRVLLERQQMYENMRDEYLYGQAKYMRIYNSLNK